MDPITLVILTLIILAAGGAGTATALRLQRVHRREKMQEAVRRKRPLRGQLLSLFDLFWDLGVSDYALEIMGAQGLLFSDPDDLHGALSRLEDLVDNHGSYAAYVDDTLEAIQEFYDEHRRAGARRLLPTLTMRQQKLLPLPEGMSPAQAPSDELVPTDGLGRVIEAPLDERRRMREERRLTAIVPDPGSTETNVDIDALTDRDVLDVLQTLFAGNFADELSRWWRMRRLRTLKKALDERLAAMYDFYTRQVEVTPGFYNHLYDAYTRWREETARIEYLAFHRPWSGRPWEICADVLVAEALDLSRLLANQAGANAYETIERIHDHARRGDFPMAGYLVFLNQHAFFAGRGTNYGEYARQIEFATYRVQEELRKLRAEGIL
jgi:hypothetical protein